MCGTLIFTHFILHLLLQNQIKDHHTPVHLSGQNSKVTVPIMYGLSCLVIGLCLYKLWFELE